MAKISNHQTTQVNFVLIPNKSIDINSISADKLKAKLSDVFENSKPITTQFPELFVIFDPNNQIGVNIFRDQNRIIISDNRVTSYSGRDLGKFFKFVKEAVDIINNNDTKDYGFNILSFFDLDDGITNSGDFIKDNFFKTEKLDSLGTLKSAGFRLVFDRNSVKYDLKIEPKLGPNLEGTKSIFANQNNHFAASQLPDLTGLETKFKEIYNDLPSNINNILK